MLLSIAQLGHCDCETVRPIPELIVLERIDGSPVAWRCSDCREKYFVRSKLTRRRDAGKFTAEFKVLIEERHKAEKCAHEMAFAAGAVLPPSREVEKVRAC